MTLAAADLARDPSALQPSYTRFRQSNELYYLCGVEVPHAYLILDGRAKKTTLFLPNRNEGREKGEGKVLSAEDAEEVKKLTGVDAVASTDVLAEQLENRYARQGLRILYTPLAPAEGGGVAGLLPPLWVLPLLAAAGAIACLAGATGANTFGSCSGSAIALP